MEDLPSAFRLFGPSTRSCRTNQTRMSIRLDPKCVSCSSNFFLANNTCNPCATCQSGKYQASACAKTANTVCAGCSAITNGAADKNVTCTSASDSQIDACASGYYLVKAEGKADTCKACTTCGKGFFASTKCSGSTNAVCKACTAVANSKDGVTITCSSASNSQTTACADGYTLTQGTADTCKLNVCICSNGQGATGTACPKSGDSVCATGMQAPTACSGSFLAPPAVMLVMLMLLMWRKF